MNICIFSGNLGSDIEVRFTPNGKCIGQFSLPVKQGWGDNEKTSWVRCKLLGDRAEKLAPYLMKGMKVTVSGEFVLEEWESNNEKHSMPCLIVNNVELPPKNSAPTPQAKVQSPNKQLTPEEIEALNDDIPF